MVHFLDAQRAKQQALETKAIENKAIFDALASEMKDWDDVEIEKKLLEFASTKTQSVAQGKIFCSMVMRRITQLRALPFLAGNRGDA